jgi:hypothetical protein
MINKEKIKRKYVIYISYEPMIYIVGLINVNKGLRPSDGIKEEMNTGFITVEVTKGSEFGAGEILVIPANQIKSIIVEE